MGKKIIIGPGRLSYPHFFKPQINDQGQERFSTALLIPPDVDRKPIIAALTEAAIETFGKDKAKWPKVMRKPEDVIRPCSDKEQYGPEFEGWYFINAASGEAPGVIDAVKEKITEPKEAYAGRWARISVNAYGYTKPTKGVTFGLNNVQLLRHDQNITGRTRAEDDFDTMAEEMEEADGGKDDNFGDE